MVSSRPTAVGAALCACVISSGAFIFTASERSLSAWAADTIKCLYAEVESSQGEIAAESGGEFDDDYVYDVYASTAYCVSSNLLITIHNVDNILPPPDTNATPASYNLCTYGYGDPSTSYTLRSYVRVGVEGDLNTATADGIFDVSMTEQGGGLSISEGTLNEITVDTYHD